MHTTNIEPLLAAVRNIEADDLRRALISYGRNFVCDTENNPVEILYDDGAEPRLATVASVSLDPQMRFHIFVNGRKGDIVEVNPLMIYPGQISNITKQL